MDFDFSPEMAELQSSVRCLAQDKVKPRAREIDRSGVYPQDLFEAFRHAGLLGLCIPETLGGSGAGILGLAVQLPGAAGCMEDQPTEQWYREAKQVTIVEGTSQVQLGLIARGVLHHDLWWD